MINLRNVRKFYGALEVIKGVDITVEDGEFAVFVGPSGCGKSTLLRMIAGLEGIDEGELILNGKRINDVPPDKRGIAMVFQSYALYPHMSVAENIGFSLSLKKVPEVEIRRQVEGVAEILQLTDYLDRRPAALSGGQRQRVAIGRAIIKKPALILFDEPLSNLDSALRVQMRAELQRLHRELKATVVYVTHDQVEAMTMADRIVVLNKGVVAQQGAPMDLYHQPDNEFVATFIGSPKMNVLPMTATRRDAGMVHLESPLGLSIDLSDANGAVQQGEAKLGIRPEHLKLAPQGQGDFSAEVVIVERLGVETYLTVGSQQQPIVVRTEGDMTIRPGDRVSLTAERAGCHLFDSAGRVIRSATA
ncbi:ABC transporter ATP-binding protein [Rhizobium leguminosarum]|uniref:ABC transporter ATP-binding protein n=1 Tax=Rhizobium leguminosarum TaxID=384 RepID=UPI001C980E8A|nr:sn-glycerol-3-phosphate ABC transporter ATP-binding protein UgpC [Rhizobium leguminosarum]MBY5663202.1 sn-glycerol-3-phosphate ABC transporter ATP-binding protein UgpC [Rhizobium leguminosarum]MBY5676405.1 sn-glycerol-3-phosphate ABC transporter ATP-binding protein UgpC [Rhizobium leguminosarum]